MDKVARIRQEIERLKKGHTSKEYRDDAALVLEDLEDFLDTLSEEPDKGLEKAAEEYFKPEWSGSLIDAFIAGAEWQKEQDTRDMVMSDNRHFNKVYELGKKDMKEQMMEEAVEGEICGRVYDHINVRFADGVCKYLEPKNISHIPADVSKYNIGDKVHIVVLKEEEESK